MLGTIGPAHTLLMIGGRGVPVWDSERQRTTTNVNAVVHCRSLLGRLSK
jgi:hypothetical protein